MHVFDLPHARHYCAPLPPAGPGVEQPLAAFHLTLGKVTRLHEGTPAFDVHRANALLSAERWLLFSVSHYRRALEMLVPASAPWAQVTLYYASFFSANALLAMFGAWIGHTIEGTRLVEVEKGLPGQQTLKISRGQNAKSPNGARGSHRVFWDHFYATVPNLVAWAPPCLASAFAPVNGDYAWQIASRNDVNYDMFHAWVSSSSLHNTFKPARLRNLSGHLQVQRGATEQLIRAALYFASDLSLAASGLANLGITGDRIAIQRKLLRQRPPSLINESALSEFVA